MGMLPTCLQYFSKMRALGLLASHQQYVVFPNKSLCQYYNTNHQNCLAEEHRYPRPNSIWESRKLKTHYR